MQQLIAGTRRAASGALAAGYQAKRAFRKPLIRWCGGIEKEKKDCDGAQSQPDDRGNRALSGDVDCDRDEMEVGHESRFVFVLFRVFSWISLALA